MIKVRVATDRLRAVDAAAKARGMTRSAYLLWCEDEIRHGAIRRVPRPADQLSLDRNDVTPIFRDKAKGKL